ncbi:MAG: hypothetical protein UW68_C0035G0003 [Candidatus Collierbacteria bacterium GW2011_GWB1_44_6]|uniref:Uncharacterized protein n=1 Tax=Candidatus Collierbacteria bacterium GW2011_GWB1_44_6 TaxID=1618384 RepID=A0A0G1JMA0_9BACT|nr:MAG: hypothetical protein UW68_C0035G0003 [Candidatus Collierbacteria bacterium GW2011_GWB1_44_6]
MLLLLLLLFFLVLFWVYRSFVTRPDKTVVTPASIQVSDKGLSEPEKIIKCQSVVVALKATTELFTYIAGNKVMADYRIGATSNEESFKVQILNNNGQVYMWEPPIYFGGPKPENPRGLKAKAPDFKYDVNLTTEDTVERFGKSPLSGDHVCYEWDGTDSVFQVPSDFEFDESEDIKLKVREKLSRVCQVCETASSEEIRAACRKNLVCD